MQEVSLYRRSGQVSLQLIVILVWMSAILAAAAAEQPVETNSAGQPDVGRQLPAERLRSLDHERTIVGLPCDKVEEAVQNQSVRVPRTLLGAPQPGSAGTNQNDRQVQNHTSGNVNGTKSFESVVACRVGGTSRPELRREALAALPLAQLTPRDQARVRQVLTNRCLFRRLPTLSFPSDRRVYEYFASHPEVAVSIWHALRISEFQLERVEPGVYKAGSSDGSSGVLEILYQAPGQWLVFGEGQYKSPLLPKPVRASAVVHLQASYHVDRDGRPFVTHRADVFVAFPSLTVDTVAHLIAPIGYLIADRNFYEVSLFVAVMSAAMVRYPEAMEQLAEQLEGVTLIDRADLVALSRAVRKESVSRSEQASVVRIAPRSEKFEAQQPDAELHPSQPLQEARGVQPAPH